MKAECLEGAILRDTLQIFFIFIELLAYCTLLVGYAKQLLVSKELKKQTGLFS